MQSISMIQVNHDSRETILSSKENHVEMLDNIKTETVQEIDENMHQRNVIVSNQICSSFCRASLNQVNDNQLTENDHPRSGRIYGKIVTKGIYMTKSRQNIKLPRVTGRMYIR